MLFGLFVAFAMQIQIDATMERHGWSAQGHRWTDENGWLKESVEPFHSEREEIESVQDTIFSVLQVLNDEDHEFMWTVHSLQFVKQAVMLQLIESLDEINVYDERIGCL